MTCSVSDRRSVAKNEGRAALLSTLLRFSDILDNLNALVPLGLACVV